MRSEQNYAKIRFMCYAATIAALYVALSMVSAAFGLASGGIQIRISEALCVLPYFSAAAIPGVTLGCFIYNLISSGNILDIVFGTLATLIGAVGARLLRKWKWMTSVPTIVANTVIIPFVLKYGFGLENSVIFFAVTIFIGELISAGVFGTALLLAIKKRISKL